ncbi:hypothetical protein JOD43_000329 [Pullulanibacillus pueri]|uniref:Uncharacterized protein n=1 Tax=Pullulanibacillus pueri TaxID=1437324 RepID=A0A8J2ZS69_9BACL|nr:hypothetical protein [Pullulanibacillus pueri]MBM7680170.1 hypothetical protein [Pullulanibacillus pueri]GGH74691.1 hypothetical protein GCM10007096_03190 [Pullulanibacillus pueri]
MKQLFLSGGGSDEQLLDRHFAREISLEKPLLYIPLAMKNDNPYDKCYEWITQLLNRLGIHHIIMWTELTGKSLEDFSLSLQFILAVVIPLAC